MRPYALKTHGKLSKTFLKQIFLWIKRLETRLIRSIVTRERISVGRGPDYTPFKHPIHLKFAALLHGHSLWVWLLFVSENSHASLFSLPGLMDMIIYWRIYVFSFTVFNAIAVRLFALARLKNDGGGTKLKLEIQYDTYQMPSAEHSTAVMG